MLLRSRLGMFFCSALVAALILQGCGVTGPTVERQKIKKMDEVAVVSVVGEGGLGENIEIPPQYFYMSLLLPPKKEVKSYLRSKVDYIDEADDVYEEFLRKAYDFSKEVAESEEVNSDSIDVPSRQEFERMMREEIEPDLQKIDKELSRAEEDLNTRIDIVVDWLYREFQGVLLTQVFGYDEFSIDRFPDFQTPIQNAHSWLFSDFSQRVPFSLLPEDQILKNEQYQQFKPTEGALSGAARMNAEVLSVTPGMYNASISPSIMKHYLNDQKKKELMSILPEETDGMLYLGVGYAAVDRKLADEEARKENEKTTREKAREGRNVDPATATVDTGPNFEKGQEVEARIETTVTLFVMNDQFETVLEVDKSAKSDSKFTYTHKEVDFDDDVDRAMVQATEKALNKLGTVY